MRYLILEVMTHYFSLALSTATMLKPKVVVASPVSLDAVQNINWNACCFCQKPDAQLSCPAKNPVASKRNAGYQSVGLNLQALIPFKYQLESGFLVESLQVQVDGDSPETKRTLSITESLQFKEARWHNTCKSRFIPPKFDAILGKAKLLSKQSESSKSETECLSEDVPEFSSSRLQTRATLPLVNAKAELCFFM